MRYCQIRNLVLLKSGVYAPTGRTATPQLSHGRCLPDKGRAGIVSAMNFFARLFSKKPVAPTPLSGEATALDLAEFLAYDGKDLDEQWFCDTCLRAGICMPNAKFAWEARRLADEKGSAFGAGIVFALRLIGAHAATKQRLVSMLKN